MIVVSELGLWMRASVIRGLIQSGAQVTYGVNIRSRVEVLAIDEDICCLGKRDQCREGKNRIEAI